MWISRNKANIALVIGLVITVYVLLQQVPSLVLFFYGSPINLWVGPLALLGLIFGVWGFRTEKVKSVLAILICTWFLFQWVPWFQETYYAIQVYNSLQTYSESDFSFQVTPVWTKIAAPQGVEGVRVVLSPSDSTEIVKPVIMVTSVHLKSGADLQAFGDQS